MIVAFSEQCIVTIMLPTIANLSPGDLNRDFGNLSQINGGHL